MKLIVHTDGGARGNPGRAAVGVVIEDENRKKIFEVGKRIGETTNNVAEYFAVVEALEKIRDIDASDVHFYLDSILVVNQLNGLFKIKDAKLRDLYVKIKILEQEVGGDITYTSVPREQNRRADFLVNHALDATLMSG